MSAVRNAWPLATIGSMSKHVTVGFVGSMSHLFVETGVPLLRGQNVQPYRLDLDGTKFISTSTHAKWRKSALEAGDVVIVRVGYPGTAAVVPEGSSPMNAASLVIVRPDPKQLNPYFLSYVLNSPWGRAAIAGRLVGSAQQVFNTKTAYDFVLPTPPLDTQRRIAAILGAYDDLIEVNRRRVALLEDMARGLFEEWFVRFRFPGHEAVAMMETPDGALPEGWSHVKVGSVLRKFRRAEKIKKQDYDPIGTIPCIDQGSDFIGGYTNNTDALIDNPLPLCVFGDHTRVLKFVTFPFASGADGTQLLYPTDDISPEYLYYSLLNVDLSNQHYARHFKFLKEETIIIPPKKLDILFTHITKPLMVQLQNFRFQNRSLAASRDLLLPRLISGQLSVTAAERELQEAA